MSIRKKIIVAMSFVSLLGVILGLTGCISMELLRAKESEIIALSGQSNAFTLILNRHYEWRNGLTDAVMTGKEFKGSLDPRTCALGQWLNSEEAKAITDKKVLDQLSQITSPHNAIHQEAGSVVKFLDAQDKDSATDHVVNIILPKCDDVIRILLDITTHYTDLMHLSESGAESYAKNSTVIMVVLIIIILPISIFIALYISGSIGKPLVALSSFMKKASSTGDIILRPEDIENISKFAKTKDEVGQAIGSSAAFVERVIEVSDVLSSISNGDLTHDINLLSDEDTMGFALHSLHENLNKMFSEINISAGEVSSGAEQVATTAANISDSSEQMASGAQSLAEGATKQAESVEEVSNSIAGIAEKTMTNAGMADQAAQLTRKIINNAEKGSRQMEEMVTSVNDINEASKSVSKIMETINGIAGQTNLLALNAAIEAARAGEHGRGFAVVAEEVRKLAVQSEEAVKETSSIIQSSMEKAESGTRVAGEMASSLTEIVAGINESNQLITEIAKASEEQSRNITQINANISQVAEIIQHNSALAEESAAAAEESAAAAEESTAAADEMHTNAETLEKLISKFQLKGDNRVTAYPKKAIMP